MTVLRGIDFGHVWGAAGVQGFHGEGWPFHRRLRFVPGFDFAGMAFTAKTVTLAPRAGNMPSHPKTLAPLQLFPACVIAKPFARVVLNAVGMTNIGFPALCERGVWFTRTAPFFLSFAAVSATRAERMAEYRGFVEVFRQYRSQFRAPVGVQLNFSCPNVEHQAAAWDELLAEIDESLNITAALEVPLVPKLSIEFPVGAAASVAAHPACDALCVSNTVPWGRLSDRIPWLRLFGSTQSPLRARGIPADGGLSGAPLLPLVAEWVRTADAAGIRKPINAGGGILSPEDADDLVDAGADSLALGSIAILRPWRVQTTIRHATARLAQRERARSSYDAGTRVHASAHAHPTSITKNGVRP
ncbi:hypothetical protein HY632_00340 [Candidatus Uhrbacteria bacterium]|nr:hypothetical protein [Candidatus Uhrbacteria bacterium]